MAEIDKPVCVVQTPSLSHVRQKNLAVKQPFIKKIYRDVTCNNSNSKVIYESPSGLVRGSGGDGVCAVVVGEEPSSVCC